MNQDPFAKNRAEELGNDVWEQFVIPLFFDSLDLVGVSKPRVIEGGRGCGKTMLLRYLSYRSTFSPQRAGIPDSALGHIGLYWRADTHFASAMRKRGVDEETWADVFSHAVALSLSLELIDSLWAIARSSVSRVTESDLLSLNLSALSAFGDAIPGQIGDLYEYLRMAQWRLESWVSNVRRNPVPLLLPGAAFLRAAITIVREQIPALAAAGFQVYVDEYENLLAYQKRIVNSWLKHSQSPLIFHVAVKRHGFDIRETSGPELLNDIHDFRFIDLEALYLEAGFEVFAAEILFHRLAQGGELDLPLEVSVLRNPDRLDERRAPEYQQRVTSAARAILPGLTQRQLAEQVFVDKAIREKLRERVAKALNRRASTLSVDLFIRPDFPEASIITPPLLHRSRLEPEEVARELDRLAAGEPNRFTGKTDWIHNNFIGALLQLYDPRSRACPFYAGFETFIYLSHGNLRHFLELCHESRHQEWGEPLPSMTPITPVQQAEAARDASVTFLSEIRSFGDQGGQLYTFVVRLGTLFQLAHRHPRLSESEPTHFSINRGRVPLTPADDQFLKEAATWSVLFIEESTKTKSDELVEEADYVLNPIYAPYFYISYRKKRKLTLSTDTLVTLMRGSADDVRALMRQFKRRWAIDEVDSAPTLFSMLDADEGA